MQNGTCKFQPQKAVAFIKDVVNISLVSRDLQRPGSSQKPFAPWGTNLHLVPHKAEAQGTPGSLDCPFF